MVEGQRRRVESIKQQVQDIALNVRIVIGSNLFNILFHVFHGNFPDLLTWQVGIVLAHKRSWIVLGLTLKNVANPMMMKQSLKLESPIKRRYKY